MIKIKHDISLLLHVFRLLGEIHLEYSEDVAVTNYICTVHC